MAARKPYQAIVDHYEQCLERHGDSHLGVDWPKAADVDIRYQVMLEVVPPLERRKGIEVLDLGCGTAHLYEYIRRHNWTEINYHGLDISAKFIALCRQKHPGVRFTCADILDADQAVPVCDYAVLNGVFTEKQDLSFDAM